MDTQWLGRVGYEDALATQETYLEKRLNGEISEDRKSVV